MSVLQLSEIVALGFEELIKEGDTREIGKFLAFPTERIIAPQWLRDVCDIATTQSPDDEDGQQEKYDRILLLAESVSRSNIVEEKPFILNRLAAQLVKMQPMVPRMVR